MNTRYAFESIAVRGLLSFGWDEQRLDLRRLNLLIGPNGAGKSNLIDIFDLLRHCGGAGEWIHSADGGDGIGSVAVVLSSGAGPLHYRVQFLKNDDVQIDGDAVTIGASSIHIYRSWNLGPRERMTQLPNQNAPNRFLLPDASNLGLGYCGTLARSAVIWPRKSLSGAGLGFASALFTAVPGLVIRRLQHDGDTREALRTHLCYIYDQAQDIEVSTDVGGTTHVLVQERGLDGATPLNRLSGGTLRWLALGAILLDPQPPPLICIENPEMGLHQDLSHVLGALLRAASERTQLIVTTQSDALVSEFSDTPEDVVVCERRGGSTSMSRLASEPLAHWLESYSLGHVWRTGAIGGNRW